MDRVSPVTESIALSVVIPVYGCAGCVEELLRRVHAAASVITEDHEIVLVDDRSPDGAWERIAPLTSGDARLRAIRLSRNYGQHAAITAGLAESRGTRVVVMDCDLEDPTGADPDLWAKADEGYDIVFARRAARVRLPLPSPCCSSLLRAINVFTNRTSTGRTGPSASSTAASPTPISIGDRSRHYLFILNWLGYRHVSIDVEQGQRRSGSSSYTLGALVQHAVDGLFFQTTVLLRWIVYPASSSR